MADQVGPPGRRRRRGRAQRGPRIEVRRRHQGRPATHPAAARSGAGRAVAGRARRRHHQGTGRPAHPADAGQRPADQRGQAARPGPQADRTGVLPAPARRLHRVLRRTHPRPHRRLARRDTLDVHDEMACLTLDIVGRTLLGIDLTDRSSEIRGSLEAALERFGAVGGGSLLIGGAGRRRSLGRRGPRPTAAMDTPSTAEADVHRVVDEVIQEHRRHQPSGDRGDLVSALLSDGQVRAGMTDQEIHDHVITMIMAGHETTANALTWALYLLGRRPDIQLRLHDEVDSLAAGGPSFSQLADLPFTRAVISEAMRLYPPAWVLGRTLVAPLDLAGWHAPAGTLVGVSPLLLHHDPRWFDNPEEFDPDRWLDGRQKTLPRNAYLPFGTGPRACIGEQFAWAEAVTVLAVIASRWTIRTPPDLAPGAQYRVTLRPSGPVPLTVAARNAPRPRQAHEAKMFD